MVAIILALLAAFLDLSLINIMLLALVRMDILDHL
jgi:hypothetical protein